MLAAAAAVFLALKQVFDTPSRTYDTNVGEVYDDWTDEGVLEYFWGEHIHLGYYSREEQQKAWKQPIWTGRHPKDFKQAKFDFIDEMLAWSQSDQPATVLDVGCGIGGTTRHLAAKFPDAKVTGPFSSRVSHELHIVKGSTQSCGLMAKAGWDRIGTIQPF